MTSPRPLVIVAETIAQAGIKALEKECDVTELVGADRDELIAAMADASSQVARQAQIAHSRLSR
jgi:hypothetical protein